MTNKLRNSFVKWQLLFAKLPSEHPGYQEQQEIQNIVIAAEFGGIFFGIIIGLILGVLF